MQQDRGYILELRQVELVELVQSVPGDPVEQGFGFAAGARGSAPAAALARRLANSLGLDEMTTSEQDVPATLFQSNGLECKGALSAMY